MTIGYQVYNQQATYFVTWQSGDCLVARTKLAGLQKLSPQTSPNSEKDTTANWGTIKPLIEDNLEAEKQQDKSIHLIDYRGIIPQDIIQSGNDFDKFIDLLLQTIKTADTVNV